MDILLILVIVQLLALFYLLFRSGKGDVGTLERLLKDDLRESRLELNDALRLNREELSRQLESLRDRIEEKLGKLIDDLNKNAGENRKELKESITSFRDDINRLQKEKFETLAHKQDELMRSTESRLEKMRETVDEKLQKTLNERLSKSFEQVGKQLESVQQGLGEMQSLAQDVGGLKNALMNVKNRGGIGEVQLEMLLESILAPEQYEKNVKTKPQSNALVEFAIKLPGRDGDDGKVWLPIDAKFPLDAYEHLLAAYDRADAGEIEKMQKNLDNAIKSMAKDISEKYISPPDTTDFAILFLPFEGIYAEVVRKASLLEEIRTKHQVIITGPTTLAAILNSLQMGFRTLAIQQRSSEVWKILGAVKTEFEKFGGLLDKAQKNIQTGLNQLDDIKGTRTRAIERKLRDVESLDQKESAQLLPGIQDDED